MKIGFLDWTHSLLPCRTPILWVSYYIIITVLLCFSKPTFPQDIVHHQVEIDRFALELKVIGDSTSIVSSNITFTITYNNSNNALTLTLPKAQELKINKNKARITDSKGNVIWKGNLGKKLLRSNSLSIKLDQIKILREGTLPYTVEWETNILVVHPVGRFTWPDLTGNFNVIKYLGLRVFADDEFKNKIETNIEQNTKLMDQSSGLSGVVWELSNLQKNKAWQNARLINNPYITITF